jgi:hypothetical protein
MIWKPSLFIIITIDPISKVISHPNSLVYYNQQIH